MQPKVYLFYQYRGKKAVGLFPYWKKEMEKGSIQVSVDAEKSGDMIVVEGRIYKMDVEIAAPNLPAWSFTLNPHQCLELPSLIHETLSAFLRYIYYILDPFY